MSTGIDNITLSFPFFSCSLKKPENIEKEIATEIVIRLKDKRVLTSSQCCDACTQKAIDSLYSIREILVDMEVKLSKYMNGYLYLMIELILESIRQFFTYIENEQIPIGNQKLFIHNQLKIYQDSLEIIRSHINNCLFQISKIANFYIDWDDYQKRYFDWNLNNYINE